MITGVGGAGDGGGVVKNCCPKASVIQRFKHCTLSGASI